ncbi:hypothetical protein GCM10010339_90310 [Streptomyces alanosinicus]|uniref:Uncharacterized protein n=1 Tax=Streptomyces alanosinicus TaxID=68171 RepID=A0A918YTY7_9ACTN|nr:hypothetical protein GCM10010339_90310 [Streptomyces alanosinicus]
MIIPPFRGWVVRARGRPVDQPRSGAAVPAAEEEVEHAAEAHVVGGGELAQGVVGDQVPAVAVCGAQGDGVDERVGPVQVTLVAGGGVQVEKQLDVARQPVAGAGPEAVAVAVHGEGGALGMGEVAVVAGLLPQPQQEGADARGAVAPVAEARALVVGGAFGPVRGAVVPLGERAQGLAAAERDVGQPGPS